MSKWIDADALIARATQDSERMYLESVVRHTPTIDAVSVVHGEWKDKEVFLNSDDNPIIEEWQSARCSVCNKYHTTPYMYYFSDYNFCPSCGAKMKGADDE